MITYFVTENYIKTRTQISQNMDVADIAPNVEVAAIDYVRPILGLTFFDDLLTKYNAQTLTPTEELVVEIVQKIVAFRAADITVPFVSFSIKNKGIQSQSGEYSASEGIEVVNYIRNQLKGHAATYEDQLKEFLKLNKDDYPLYTSDANKEILPPEDPETSVGMDWI